MTTSGTAVGLLHPGEMGSAIGATLVAGGARVLWASEHRSSVTRSRAAELGLADAGTLAGVARESRAIVSVTPPHGALELARAVAAVGFRGLYVDANAVAPGTAREIARVVEGAGARFVDGGIIGPANRKPGAARIYLSGESAREISPLFARGPIDAVVLDAPAGAASALKMSYAAWTKGTAALLADILALAEHEGVATALDAEWAASQPDLARATQRMAANARKAWRWIGEMQEIAASFATANLPDGFHRASADVYARLQGFKDAAKTPDVSAIVDALRSGKP